MLERPDKRNSYWYIQLHFGIPYHIFGWAHHTVSP